MLPARIVDPHHHFFDSSLSYSAFDKATNGHVQISVAYTPEEYAADAADLNIEKSIHVEVNLRLAPLALTSA